MRPDAVYALAFAAAVTAWPVTAAAPAGECAAGPDVDRRIACYEASLCTEPVLPGTAACYRRVLTFLLSSTSAPPAPSGTAPDRAPPAALPRDVVIARVFRQAGVWRFVLDDGSVWVETEPSRVRAGPGDQATLHGGMFGAVRLLIRGGGSTTVRPVRPDG